MANSTNNVQVGDEYLNYTKRLAELKQNISERIANITDPIQAIEAIVHGEGSSLKTVWESDSGYPIDGVLILIIMIPIAYGIIGHYIALQWKPTMTGEELYDDYGNRIVEYPKIPIAYLQQTKKDLSAVRENRNSLAWLCHKWLISTNEVVQELQGALPLERPTLTTVPEESGIGKRVLRRYDYLQQGAADWKAEQKRVKKNDRKRELDARIRIKPLHTLPPKLTFRKAPAKDVEYLKKRIVRAKRLWNKMNQWLEDILRPRRESFGIEGQHSASPDSKDSYWTSSETFSSDSGEHWKSYKSAVRHWTTDAKGYAQWRLATRKKMYEQGNEQAAGNAARQKKATEEAAVASKPKTMSRNLSIKSKLTSKSGSNKFGSKPTNKFF